MGVVARQSLHHNIFVVFHCCAHVSQVLTIVQIGGTMHTTTKPPLAHLENTKAELLTFQTAFRSRHEYEFSINVGQFQELHE